MRFLGDDHFAQPSMQSALVPWANTARGRAKLCITDDVPKNRSIISMHRNRYTWITDQQYRGMRGAMRQLRERRDGEPISLTTDFRCGSKFASRLNALHVAGALPFDARIGWAATVRRRKLLYIPGLSVRTAYADSATYYPDPSVEVTSVDGYAYRSASGSSWSSIRNSAGTYGADGTTHLYGSYLDPETSGLWNLMLRSFCLFDTSSIGAGHSVDAATLSLYGKAVKTDGANLAPSSNIYASDPASNTALVAADYAAVSRVPFSDAISYAAWGYSYNDFDLNTAGLAAIDTGGVSKFSAQGVADASDTEPTWAGSAYSYTKAYTADQSGTTRDPKLVVEYSVASSTYRGFVDRLLLGAG